MKTFPRLLSAGEEKGYLERCKEDDQSVKDILIGHNMRLVVHVVKRYQGSNHNMEGLLSVGTIGLIKTMSTSNAGKGSRLATYAAKCMENKILMLLRANRKYSKEVSLFKPIEIDKDGETVSLANVIETDNKGTLGTMIFKQDVKKLCEAFESCLTETGKTVLGTCCGLYRGKGHTQREIAGKLGISRPCVSRIEKRAIERIRTEFTKHG